MTRSSRRGLILGGAAAAGRPGRQWLSRSVAGFAVNRAGAGTASHARVRHSAGTSGPDVARWCGAGGLCGLEGVGGRSGGLKAYIASLSRLAPLTLTRPEQFAFWANLYNAVTIDVVLDAYPVRSIRDIRSGLLARPVEAQASPRSAGSNCRSTTSSTTSCARAGAIRASIMPSTAPPISCPNLPLRAWRGAALEPALDAAARAYVNSHAGSDASMATSLVVSSIYKWYAADFGGTRCPRHRPSGPLCKRTAEDTAGGRDTHRPRHLRLVAERDREKLSPWTTSNASCRLLVLVVGVIAIFASGVTSLSESRGAADAMRRRCAAFVDDNLILALVGLRRRLCSRHGGQPARVPSILTLAGGYLFGTWVGGTATVIGATIGAVARLLCRADLAGRGAAGQGGGLGRHAEEGHRRGQARGVRLYPDAAADPGGPVLAGQCRGGARECAAASLCAGDLPRDHAGDLHLQRHRGRHRGPDRARRDPRSGRDFRAEGAAAAGRRWACCRWARPCINAARGKTL